MADQVNIQLRFSVETKHGTFSDALWFTEEEWATRDPVAIDALKQQRADAHVALIDGRTSPTKEDYQNLAASLGEQATDIGTRKAEAEAEAAKFDTLAAAEVEGRAAKA